MSNFAVKNLGKNLKRLSSVFEDYGIVAAYLFGSQASGRVHSKSDLDIALRFKKKLSLKDNLKLNNEIGRILEMEIDLTDLDEAPLPLQFRVYGARKLIFAEDLKKELLLSAKAISMYFDQKYYYDRYTTLEIERILSKGLI